MSPEQELFLVLVRLRLGLLLQDIAGADLGFFVPQSTRAGRRGVGAWRTGRHRRWAWSRLGVVDSKREGALNNFYADSPPLDF